MSRYPCHPLPINRQWRQERPRSPSSSTAWWSRGMGKDTQGCQLEKSTKKPNIKNAREQKRTRERVRLEPPSPDPREAYTLVSVGRSIARVAGLGESRLPKERGCPCCDGEESHCKPKAASVPEKGKKSLCPCLAQQNGTRSHRKDYRQLPTITQAQSNNGGHATTSFRRQ